MAAQSDNAPNTAMPDWMAIVRGEPLAELPKDLYIPPDALEVFLDAFSGPLDLLLYLIRRNNLDILDIPIAQITRQYIEYIGLMSNMRLELAAEYLVMAATLAEIKSRMLLPRSQAEEGVEDDPRAELVRRLQEYEQFKLAAVSLDELPRLERDNYLASTEEPDMNWVKPLPEVDLKEVLMALKDALKRVELKESHTISRETLSVRERMSQILAKLSKDHFCRFESCLIFEEGSLGVVVSFIAILELLKQAMIELVQTEPYTPIHIKAVS